MTDAPDPDQGEPTFGARFLDEYRRLGGSLVPLEYAVLQEIRRSDREGLIRALRAAQPMSTSYATIQRIRTVATPEELALDLIRARQAAAAASGMTLIAMMTMLG